MPSKPNKNITIKNPSTPPEEINLFQIIDDLLKEKIKITIFSIIAGILGAVLYFTTPKTFEVYTDFSPAKSSFFLNYYNLNKVLESNNFGFSMMSDNIFNLVKEEFNDLDELRSVLLKNENINNQFLSNLDNKAQMNLINDFAKKFKIILPLEDKKQWKLKFVWSDVEEGKEIFNSSMRLSQENLQKSLINDLEKYANFIDFQNRQTKERLKNEISMLLEFETLKLEKRVLYLSEQAEIARSLGIQKNNLDEIELSSLNQNIMEFNVSTSSMPEYLRGYDALEKERDLLIERSTKEILLSSNDYIEKINQINQLDNDIRSEQLRAISSIITTDNPHNWVYYDFTISESNNIHRSLIFYLTLSLLLGVFSISFYILASKAYSDRKAFSI